MLALGLALLLAAPTDAEARKRKRAAAPKPTPTAVQDVALYSRVAVVVDAADDEVLFRHGADTPRPIASITKLMTALVVVEANQPLDEFLTITAEDAAATSKSGSRLPVGSQLTRGELLRIALMASDNRAAHALARNFPGGAPACVMAMRLKAGELGMTRTRFVEPTGLSSGNVSTSADLPRLVRAAAAVPLIHEYSTTPALVVPVRGQLVEFHNTSLPLLEPGWDVRLQKTGYIREAGRCLVLQTRVAGHEVVIVLLDAAGRAARVADARRLKRWLETQWVATPAPIQASAEPVLDVEAESQLSNGGT